jgi:hypothetical protein
MFAGLTVQSLVAAAMFLASCVSDKPANETAAPVYEMAQQIEAMPPCKATVVHRYPCYSLLRTTDGKKFCIGSPGATPEVSRFLETLKDGRTYRFPDAFLSYQQQHPR